MYEGSRRYHRYPVFAQAVVTTKDTESSSHFSAQVNNISQGGMGFYISIPLEKATPVSVEFSFFANEEKDEERALQGTVASLSKQYDEYFMGICFDEPLTYEHLMKIMKWD